MIVPIESKEIARILPHRFPFLLVDRILAFEPDRKIVGIKNVTINEPFFSGHFPNDPIMPGVLIIEVMAQVAALLAVLSQKGEEGASTLLTGVDRARFRKPVLPGDQMKMTVEVRKSRPPFWQLMGVCTVEEAVVAEAALKAMVTRKERP